MQPLQQSTREKLTNAALTVRDRYGVSNLIIGSIEDFRTCFDEYSDFILGEYDNWPGEYWIDMS